MCQRNGTLLFSVVKKAEIYDLEIQDINREFKFNKWELPRNTKALLSSERYTLNNTDTKKNYQCTLS